MDTTSQGSLVVVGTGIRFGAHLTAQSSNSIERADKVLYVVADPITRVFLKERGAESLETFYDPERKRTESYEAMVERTLSFVRAGQRVCLALYGHPGVFACVGHIAIARARAEGYAATMLPAISAEDCLFADLGIDPAERGCQTFEATDYVLRGQVIDPSCAVIIFQISSIGEYRLPVDVNRGGLRVLTDLLCEQYPASHEVVVYLASIYAVVPPVMLRVQLGDLAEADVPPMATLYVPPLGKRKINVEMRERLRAATAAAAEELATSSV